MDRASRAATQWRAECPEMDLLPMELLGRLAETALVIERQHLAPVFAQFGLQGGEFDVLAALRRSGAPYALSPSALFDVTMMSSGGMTARIDRLEKAGLVARRPNPADRRGTLVGLTDAGRTLIDQAMAAHLANEAQIVGALSRAEQDTLSALLKKLLGGLPGT
ncbi:MULTISPECIES: MarR family winged helix-turn-helix transcriptional regulator [Actibacterium]|uniref:DNA-binding MarR family transcriptional regulator n=1 Tax=Actibacterium naphthalenivorans TaxID=1614693 RepID=A0A840CAK7_9RHOB|nr:MULTISPECIES: MarR family transcriptional regulator [Actibacterium]ALG90756.1 MarR family transcriptional regulator [Actibacterium sp. EMB200-NS6]MBB4023031.1 DNA-binding MarR family transcriptional regulator [Actibacterium naphthalenivorans]